MALYSNRSRRLRVYITTVDPSQLPVDERDFDLHVQPLLPLVTHRHNFCKGWHAQSLEGTMWTSTYTFQLIGYWIETQQIDSLLQIIKNATFISTIGIGLERDDGENIVERLVSRLRPGVFHFLEVSDTVPPESVPHLVRKWATYYQKGHVTPGGLSKLDIPTAEDWEPEDLEQLADSLANSSVQELVLSRRVRPFSDPADHPPDSPDFHLSRARMLVDWNSRVLTKIRLAKAITFSPHSIVIHGVVADPKKPSRIVHLPAELRRCIVDCLGPNPAKEAYDAYISEQHWR